MSEEHDKCIEIQSGSSHIRVNISSLLYAEVYDWKTILHLKDENIEYYGQLSALEGLVGNDFFRIHRSYLVNMKYGSAKILFYVFKESFSNRCKGLIAVPDNVYSVFKLWRKGPEYKAASLRGVNKMLVGQKVSKTFTGKD